MNPTPSTVHPRTIAQRLILALAALAAATLIASCNTTEGAGKDIKSLGKGIEETARDAKD